ncbi:hypothetical protein V2W45_1466022 [Cenococcum geophilum]
MPRNQAPSQNQYLPNGTACSYVKVTIEDRLTGNERRIADNDNIYGLMSSYPAACLAAVKVFRSGINNINLNFIYKYAEAAINVLLISYVKDAKLYGSIFDFKNTSGVVLLVYTSFFIDYIKPLKALIWPLRELLNSYKFLLILEARRHNRARFWSALRPRTNS